MTESQKVQRRTERRQMSEKPSRTEKKLNFDLGKRREISRTYIDSSRFRRRYKVVDNFEVGWMQKGFGERKPEIDFPEAGHSGEEMRSTQLCSGMTSEWQMSW
jgi:hypothetical protein